MDKPEINYPCNWKYKLIGTDENLLKKSVFNILAKRGYRGQAKLNVTNKSRTGKYVTINLSLLVDSEEMRLTFFEDFKKIESLKVIM